MPEHNNDQDAVNDLIAGVSLPPLPKTLMSDTRFTILWRAVRHEEWSKEDWIDLRETIESFKRRLVLRHRPSAAQDGGRP